MGYNSSQELLKVVRDMRIIQPNFLITYDGVNEVGVNTDQYFFTTRYQQKLMERLVRSKALPILPNLSQLMSKLMSPKQIQSYSMGPKSKGSKAQHWKQNIAHINALSALHNVHYFPILQPNFAFTKNPQKTALTYPIKNDNYLVKAFRKFYPDAIDEATHNEQITDLTAALDDLDQAVYTDSCHLNKQGNEIIARAIFERLSGSLSSH